MAIESRLDIGIDGDRVRTLFSSDEGDDHCNVGNGPCRDCGAILWYFQNNILVPQTESNIEYPCHSVGTGILE
ncbi:MAG: hypothetical protein NTX38_08740 [Methylobacter sp.]|nr:hypothetical protein [Methylobacter sp.]